VGGTASFNVNNQNTITIGGISGYGTTTLGNGSLNVGGNNVSTTYSGAFTGSSTAAITKSGTGTLRLTASPITNTLNYLGAVNVSNGTLLVNGSLANASGFTVATGATLGGLGTVSAITANAGAKIAPGDSAFSGGIGTLTATTLSITNGTHFVFDLGTLNASDMLALSGALTADSGASLFTFDFSGGEVNDVYTLATFASTNLSVSQLNASGAYAGTFAITGGNTLTFTASAVPEPATWVLIGAGLGVTLLSVAAGELPSARQGYGLNNLKSPRE
jgi:hypothetical protein